MAFPAWFVISFTCDVAQGSRYQLLGVHANYICSTTWIIKEIHCKDIIGATLFGTFPEELIEISHVEQDQLQETVLQRVIQIVGIDPRFRRPTLLQVLFQILHQIQEDEGMVRQHLDFVLDDFVGQSDCLAIRCRYTHWKSLS